MRNIYAGGDKMIKRRRVMAELILVAVVGGLMTPVYADDTPAYDGYVYGCGDVPLQDAAVHINNTNESFTTTVYTNDTGYYFVDSNKTYPMENNLVILTATYGEFSVTKEVIVPASGPITVNFTLCVKILDKYITALPDSNFTKNPDQRKNALSKKLEEVRLMIEAGEYEEAIEKLEHDIRAKADGSLGGNPKNDWISDSEAQNKTCAMIDGLIADLEALL